MTKRLVSGIQPTGKMHLGNYLGAIQNWTQLQNDYEAYFIIVDLHSLTTLYDNTSSLKEDKLNLAIDLLASGVDPEKSCLFYQSDIIEHAELHLILSMITPLPWLTRVPTYKGKMAELKEKDLDTYGFLGYPVLQAADILLYQGEVVPVGKDQLPHLELAREIIRRLNYLTKTQLPEPIEKISNIQLLPGTDGRKMSKSYNNTIPLNDTNESTQKIVMRMMTDPSRQRRDDPGNPDVCPVYNYHKIFNTPERCETIATSCKTAQIGCVDCKKECAETLIETLRPYREKRAEIEKNLDYVEETLNKGAIKAKETATKTMAKIKSKIGLTKPI